ncbi:MAG: sigma-70 family RNA polymerase sigma factor [Thermoguttaceae bacterium]|nr:sigma-70 family RNA polymerase sigma factor [Thermoguttaceae bacterium]MDW8037354.1 sigma-70 family RNA polymerase sigma factor [Thermoguttaceae bacterium]
MGEADCQGRSSLSTATSLIWGIQQGQAESWERFVDIYSLMVYGWCRRAGLRPADASDVLQDIFARVAEKIAQFRKDQPGSSFRGWLWRVAQNKIRDFFRAAGPELPAVGGTDAHQRLESVAEPQSSEPLREESKTGIWTGAVRRALSLIQAEFEPKTWQAFWRTAVEEAKPADVAEELGMSPGAVRQAKYKVLRRLRLELGDLPGPSPTEQKR